MCVCAKQCVQCTQIMRGCYCCSRLRLFFWVATQPILIGGYAKIVLSQHKGNNLNAHRSPLKYPLILYVQKNVFSHIYHNNAPK